MSHPIQLPQVGESVTEAVIGKWLKQVGDHVDKYDPLVEVVTDKVNMEVPAPFSGTLTEIVVEENATVPMGAVIAQLEPDEGAEIEPASAGQVASSETKGDEAPIDRVGRMVSGANVGPTGGVFADSSLTPTAPDLGATSRRVPAVGPGDSGKRMGYFSPVVLRLAREHGIDPQSVKGTGLGGRVTRRDIQAEIERRRSAQGTSPTPAGEPREDQIVEPSPVRRMIAANMVRSWNEIPHAWTTVETDVTGLVALREGAKDAFQSRHGMPLTLVAFSLSAVAAALQTNPLANASWEDGKIRMHGHVNIGVAVAGKNGLVVPVVQDADTLSVSELAKSLAPLVTRAREGTLTVEDVRGGTFTLNNTGALGSVWGGAIINPPQVAILNTEAVVKRPIVIEGSGGDAIAIRSMMNLCLSFDHRVLDGAEAAAFARDVKQRLESFRPGFPIE